MSRWVAVVLIVHVAAAAAGPPSFKPPSRIRAAQDHFQRGTTQFDAHDYSGAATEYAAAYALDPDAKWLLLDIAIARRKALACPEAIDAYKAFLAENPPDDQADKARQGQAECVEAIVEARRQEDASREATDAQAREATEAAAARARVEADQRQREVDERTARQVHAIVVQTARRIDVRDRALELGVSGAAIGLIAGGVYLFARHEASDTFSAASPSDFESRRSAALALRDASWIGAGAAVAVVATGAIYYALEREPPSQTIGLAPTSSGAMLVLAGAL